MTRSPAQKISDILICLSILALIAEALLLPWINALAYFRYNLPKAMTFQELMAIFEYDFDDGLGNLFGIFLASWSHLSTTVLSLFLWTVAVCGALILIQGIRILSSIADGTPFSPKNSRCRKKRSSIFSAIPARARRCSQAKPRRASPRAGTPWCF